VPLSTLKIFSRANKTKHQPGISSRQRISKWLEEALNGFTCSQEGGDVSNRYLLSLIFQLCCNRSRLPGLNGGMDLNSRHQKIFGDAVLKLQQFNHNESTVKILFCRTNLEATDQK